MKQVGNGNPASRLPGHLAGQRQITARAHARPRRNRKDTDELDRDFCRAHRARPILIATSAKKQAGDKDQPMGVQAGYLALVLGGFGLLAQWLSFSAVMLVFVLVTGVITAANRWLLAPRRDGGALEFALCGIRQELFPHHAGRVHAARLLVEPFQIPSRPCAPAWWWGFHPGQQIRLRRAHAQSSTTC